MSDPHHHDSHDSHDSDAGKPVPPLRLVSAYTDGGHEIDSTPNTNLFVFLGVMIVLMVGASIGVYQLFVAHTDNQLSQVASVQAVDLREKIERDLTTLTTWGKYERDGKLVSYRMPIDEAKKRVLANPALFVPAPPPPDWVHPDDAK